MTHRGKYHTFKSLTLLFFIAVSFSLATSCSSNQWRSHQGVVWNTTYDIKYYGSNDLSDSVFECFALIDKSVSVFNPRGLVTLINNNITDSVDNDFCFLFEKSQQASRRSGGLFDPTVGPLVELWGFGRKKLPEVVQPDSADIMKARLTVGILDCSIEGNKLLKKHPDTQFNFSAIAKGFGCDKIADMFRRNGVTDFLIEIGGEIRTGGCNPNMKEWVVQIDAPVVDNGVLHLELAKIRVSDCGVATSGNYRNNRRDNTGTLIGHTISPLTGYPVITDVLSATVITPTAAEADAMATACMAMDGNSALSMINAIDNAEALIVLDKITGYELPPGTPLRILYETDDWTVVTTPGFPEVIK